MIILLHMSSPSRQLSPNFNADEFMCRCGCGYALIDTELVHVLEGIRSMLDVPIKINSGYRCPKRNAAVGGAKLSRHLIGCAADISWAGISLSVKENSRFRKELPNLALITKLYGIGWGENFVHVDTDVSRKQLTQWSYPLNA